MSYTRVNWENGEQGGTPLSAQNLNIMDQGISALEDEVIDLKQLTRKTLIYTTSSEHYILSWSDGKQIGTWTEESTTHQLYQFLVRCTVGANQGDPTNGVLCVRIPTDSTLVSFIGVLRYSDGSGNYICQSLPRIVTRKYEAGGGQYLHDVYVYDVPQINYDIYATLNLIVYKS